MAKCLTIVYEFFMARDRVGNLDPANIAMVSCALAWLLASDLFVLTAGASHGADSCTQHTLDFVVMEGRTQDAAVVDDIERDLAKSRRAAAGRAELLANFWRRGMGRIPRKCKLRGPCGVTSGVTSGYPVHFAGA